ncbi:hypothetical protein LEMLEM_LOCUS15 [Lemmus lemmus]
MLGLKAIVSCLKRVLGTQPTARAASAFNHCVISPVPVLCN